MNRRRWCAAAVALAAVLMVAVPYLMAAYTYYYSLTMTYNPWAITTSDWWINGWFDAGPNGLTGYLTGPTIPANLISKVAVPDSTSEYEVKFTVPSSNGMAHVAYLRATSDAVYLSDPFGTATGTFYAVVAWAGYVDIVKCVGGTVTTLSHTSGPGGTSYTMRAVMKNGKIIAYANGNRYEATDSTITTGQPGIGTNAWWTSSSSYAGGISTVQLGPLDRVAPVPSGTTPTATPTSPYSVTLSWTAGSDDSNGSGLWLYAVLRNGTQIGTTTGTSFVDSTVAEFTSYTYTVRLVDYHDNTADMTSVGVTTPAVPGPWSTLPDGRRTGVRATGTYWGGGGENIDLLTGNLNFTSNLVKAQGRGIAAVFGLSYNSQTWRKDGTGGSATTYKLGQDVGYGFGWRLMAGSITAYWADAWTPAYYLFADSTGAEYRLDQNSSGIWTTREGIYLSYEPTTKRLYFNDGTFWVMDSVSSASEQDFGTRYPTTMQSTNGNQILITYKPAIGSSTANTSARIDKIYDVRACCAPSYWAYAFTYNSDSIPHLTGISDTISSGANYDFTYSSSYTLASPFSGGGGGFGSAVSLASVKQASANTMNKYEYNSSGEMTKVIFPTGGEFRYAYREFAYTASTSKALREVSTRSLVQSSGATPHDYTFVREDSSGTALHAWTCVNDASGASAKKWSFETSSSNAGYTLMKQLDETSTGCSVAGTPSSMQVMRKEEMTWSTSSSSNPYVSSAVTRMGTSSTTGSSANSAFSNSTTTQSVDGYGNTTAKSVWDFSNSTGTATWAYASTYLTSNSNYTSRFIRNRLLTSSVTYGGTTYPLVDITYDSYTSGSYAVAIAAVSGKSLHDYTNYPTTFQYRGNPSFVTANGDSYGTRTGYDELGVAKVSNRCGPGGCLAGTAVTTDSTDTVPTTLTPNSNSSLAVTVNYNAALQVTGQTAPNSASSSIGYDSAARPTGGTSALGAVTSIGYAGGGTSQTPLVVTTTINPSGSDPRWTKTTSDGLGRTVKSEAGHGSTTEAVTDVEYAPCGCTPMGKMKKTSLPHTSGGTVYWTTYNYDALGRTTSVDLPSTMGSTTYEYVGNTVKVTDPAGKWKKFYLNANQTLASVEEPNPAGGSNLVSTYTYNYAGALLSVATLRNSSAQTRTFTYDAQGRPYQTTNPESGTMTNAYNADGTLASVTDAKGQKKTFDYDAYLRVTAVHRWTNSTTEDTNQKVEYYYDSNSYESDLNSNLAGRPAVMRYWSLRGEFSTTRTYAEIIESYGYTAAGTITKKRMRVKARKLTSLSPVDAVLETQYSYDNEGRRTQMLYPPVSGTSRTFDYTYDNMGRPSTMTEALSGGGTTTWVSAMSYNVAGQMTSGPHGNYTYNVLGQMTRQTHSSTTFDEEYRYSTSANNGKMQSKKNYVSGEDVTYTYDALQRLASATTTQAPTTDAPTWGNSYSYDVYGNLTDMNVTAGSAPSLHVTYDAATNRQNAGATAYDSNGNDIGTGSTVRAFDIDNRLTTASSTVPGTFTYGYDASNKRILKSVGWDGSSEISTKLYLHTLDGSRIGEYQFNFNSGGTTLTLDLVSANVWFGSRLLREGEWAVVQDLRGSVRWRQNVTTSAIEKADYYPFGQEKPSATTQGREKFGSYLRDETGLDYADQRYFSSTVGRFMTADPYKASGGPGDPASWNRYKYAGSDPINLTDRQGLQEKPSWCDIYWDDPICVAFGTTSTGGGTSPPNPYCAMGLVQFCESNDPNAITTYRIQGHKINVQNIANSRSVDRALGWLRSALGSDEKCRSWFLSGTQGTGSALDRWFDNIRGRIGIGDFSGDDSMGVGALAGVSFSIPTLDIVFNNGGSFFNPMQSGQHFFSRYAGVTGLFGGTDRTQVFMLIHELAHMLEIPKFGRDFNDQSQSGNNDLIWEHCSQLIERFANAF